MIKSCDIIAFTETWKGPDYDVVYPGYKTWHFARNHRHKNAKRDSGGFLILISEKHKRNVEVHQHSEHIVWVTLRNALNCTNCIVHIGFVYIPPAGSTYKTDACYYEQLQNEISNHATSGKVILCGDFNARTGHLEDFIEDANTYGTEPVTIARFNKDNKVNSFGKLLVDICKYNGLQIMNGRKPFDRESTKYTCYRPTSKNKAEGKSTVDYLITQSDMVKHIKSFTVMSKRVDSDHCPLHFEMDGLFKPATHVKDKAKHTPVPKYFKWDHTKKNEYCLELN